MAGRRLTLIEMLVATSLGVILVGLVVFVWQQSNKIFTVTVNRLESYQRLRTVLDTIERDLANTARTVDMEFFHDLSEPRDDHYDENTDQLFLVNGRSFREPYDHLDLLKGQDEFGLEGFSTVAPYVYAPVVLSPEPYTIDAGYTDGRAYWRDEVYVRSFASVRGTSIPALVHYRLVQLSDGRSALRRRVWFQDEHEQIVQPAVTPRPDGSLGPEAVAERAKATDQVSILSQNIADLKVGFYFKESPLAGDGRWYQVGAMGSQYADERARALAEVDRTRGFLDATALPGDAQSPPLSLQHAGPLGQFEGRSAVSFYYDGVARIELCEGEPPTLRALQRDVDVASQRLTAEADLGHYTNFGFPGVRPGDTFFLYDAVDDDDRQVTGANADGTAGAVFAGQVLTVDAISVDPSRTWIGVRFREPINFYRLVSTWLGSNGRPGGEPFEVTEAQVGKGGAGGGSAPYPLAGPPRKITASFNVRYRVGFLPAAFLVRLSADDRYNKRILPMERVIRLLQQ